MPLLDFHIGHQWSDAQVRGLLDTAHSVVVEAFDVPERDRYQVVSKHDEWIVLDTGLGIDRSARVVIVRVVSRRRTRAQKERFYALLAERIERECGIKSADLIVSITENEDEDWSFGHGRAQFLTGELS
jgi:hypothetical protein